MNILGISSGFRNRSIGHDNGAVLLSGDKIVGISSERLDRIKKSVGYVVKVEGGEQIAYKYDSCQTAIEYCLEYFGVTELDLLVYYNGDEDYLMDRYKPKRIIRIKSHHLAHCCSSYFCSTFNDAAVISIDGCGSVEGTNYEDIGLQSIYFCKDNNVDLLKTTLKTETRKISIGLLYHILTNKLFGLSSEGTTMGLSSYGKYNPKFDNFKFFVNYDNHIYLNDIFTFGLNDGELETLSTKMLLDFFGYKENDITKMKKDIINSELADIAYKLQKEVEENLVYLANEAYKLTKSKNLCIAGGVGLNCIANKLILDNTPFENIFISPPADDSGIALGCALYGKNIINNDKNRFIMNNAFLGKEYLDKEINNGFKKYKDYLGSIIEEDNIFKKTASLLSEGKIIGWFQGGSEIGPRALGHRSIIADSRSIKIRDKVNEVKNREKWRPLAPIILEEEVSKYFDISYPSRFMLLVAKAKDKAIIETPGIVHIDNTARIQSVTKQSSESFYYLLKEFKKITNTPVLINTSFNFAGEPIVETPEDAIKSFLSSKLDYLVINNYLISKEKIFKEFIYKRPLMQIKEITIISGTSVISHEQEVLRYYNEKKYVVNYVLSDKLDVEVDKGKFKNIQFIDNIYKINSTGTYIFFSYIPDEKLNIYNPSNKYIFIGNIKDTIDTTNKKIKKIDTYNFFRIPNVNNEIKKKLINANINNLYNINYPSGTSLINSSDKLNNIKISKKFIYDIVVTLGGGVDILLIDSLLPLLTKYKILLIGKNHPHSCIVNNINIINKWEEYKNVDLINMVDKEKLFLLLYVSKIGLLPFNKNVKTDITRIADLLSLGKNVLTNMIDANKHIDNLIFCTGKEDFLNKINLFLENNNYKENYTKIKKYYLDNFRINLILDKINNNF